MKGSKSAEGGEDWGPYVKLGGPSFPFEMLWLVPRTRGALVFGNLRSSQEKGGGERWWGEVVVYDIMRLASTSTLILHPKRPPTALPSLHLFYF
jgi:hypothetical protein